MRDYYIAQLNLRDYRHLTNLYVNGHTRAPFYLEMSANVMKTDVGSVISSGKLAARR